MPITAVFPSITFPHRGAAAKDVFVASQETAQDLLSGALTSALNTFKTEANALETNVNSKEASAMESSLSASNSSLSAQGSANYQGVWTPKGYTVGQTASDANGLRWLCKTTHVTAQVIAEGIYWTIAIPYVGAIGNINSPLLDLPLKNSLAIKAGVGTVTFTRSTTATYIDRYGVLKTAAIDTPRFEKEGYLNEGSSTNLLIASEDFSNVNWIKNSTTVATNTADTLDPYGTNLADKITKTATISARVHQSITASYDNLSGSIFAKAGDLTSMTIALSQDAGATTFARGIINLTTGSVTPSVGTANMFRVTALSNGWFRISVSAVPTVAGEYRFIIYPDEYSNAVAGSIYVMGAQLEDISFTTSYIPTTTVGVTRASDSTSIAASGNIGMPSAAKTIIIDFDILGHKTGIAQNLFELSSASQYNRIVSSSSTLNTNVSYYSSAAMAFSATPQEPNTKTRIAYVIADDNLTSVVQRYKDGMFYQGTESTILANVAPTTIYIGRAPTGLTANHYGHISDIRIYDKALSSMEVALA